MLMMLIAALTSRFQGLLFLTERLTEETDEEEVDESNSPN